MYECVSGMDNAIAGPSGAHHVGGDGGGNSSAEENIYESVDEVRQRHLMANIDVPGCSYVSGIYGRLDVIGHGIGRIERHLSSSCGSGIDNHYGYPIQAPPPGPLSTVHPFPGGYATLPSSSTSTSSHMHNVHPHHNHPPPAVPLVPVVPVSPLALAGPTGSGGVGAVMVREVPPALSAVSVQWLLVNRWLPLWIANSDGINGSRSYNGHYCHAPVPSGSSTSTTSTYYHYQQQQMDLPDYHCLPQQPQHQQLQHHQQLQVQQTSPASAAPAIQPSLNAPNTSNTGSVFRRNVAAIESNSEGNGEVSEECVSPPPPQQQSTTQQQ